MTLEVASGEKLRGGAADAEMSTNEVGISQVGPGLMVCYTGLYAGISVQPESGAGESFVEIDGIGTGNYPYLASFYCRGTVEAQTATGNTDVLWGQVIVGGDGVTSPPNLPPSAKVVVRATETFDATHKGVSYLIQTVKTGASAFADRVFIDGNGNTCIRNGALALDVGNSAGAGVAFASLPASPTLGMMAVITNCSTQVWGATADGAGANKVLVWYNGTNWTVAGK